MIEVSEWIWAALGILISCVVFGVMHLSAKLDTVMRQLEAVLKTVRPDRD